MKNTNIDNTDRVFVLWGDYNVQRVCNITDLESCFSQYEDKANVQIRHLYQGQTYFVKRGQLREQLRSRNLSTDWLRNVI